VLPRHRRALESRPHHGSRGLASTRRGPLLGVLAALLVLAACSPASTDLTATTEPVLSPLPSSPATTSGTPSELTSRWSPPEQSVLGAYDAAMTAFDLATAEPPNPDQADLAATTVDPVLTDVRNLAATWKGFGQALRYPADSVHTITALSVEINGDTATIETCNVDDGILYEPATGTVLNNKVTTAHDRATMTLVDGTWKLSTRQQIEKWDGVTGCAVTSP
jgi:hypothetical protein